MNAPCSSALFATLDDLERFASGGVLHVCDLMVLLHIDANNSIHAAALAETLGVARPKISRSLVRLSTAELLEETVNQADHRISLYRLSHRGEHVVFEVKKKFGAPDMAKLFRDYCALQHATRAFEQDFGVSHLSDSAQRVLLVLGEGDATQVGCTQTEICKVAHLAQNRVSAAIDVLCEKGLVKKRQASRSRREVAISLTQQGKQGAKSLFNVLVAAK